MSFSYSVETHIKFLCKQTFHRYFEAPCFKVGSVWINCAYTCVCARKRELLCATQTWPHSPLEWNEIRQSHSGQFSAGSLRMTSSSNVTTVMYLNRQRRSRISFIGLDLDFLAMAQIPTTICLSGGCRKEWIIHFSAQSSPASLTQQLVIQPWEQTLLYALQATLC